MLTEERRSLIVKTVDEKGIVTVQELTDLLQTSESTLRRDLISLDEQGLVSKIHGGAAKRKGGAELVETVDVNERYHLNKDAKLKIAKRAAQMVTDSDVVYLDAGSTTEYVIDFLPNTKATFVTNAAQHAVKLVNRGFKVFVIGGELRRKTAAYIGAFAFDMLKNFNFTIGFFGTDGVHAEAGYTTPEENEAIVKSFALSRCKKAYALCDGSKFGKTAFVSFASLASLTLVSDGVPDFLPEGEMIKV